MRDNLQDMINILLSLQLNLQFVLAVDLSRLPYISVLPLSSTKICTIKQKVAVLSKYRDKRTTVADVKKNSKELVPCLKLTTLHPSNVCFR